MTDPKGDGMKLFASLMLGVLLCVIVLPGCVATPPPDPERGEYYDTDLDGTNNQGRLVQ